MRSLFVSLLSLALVSAHASPSFDGDDFEGLVPRDGHGSVHTPAGLRWYDPDFSHGTAGKSDPAEYTCFRGPASNFPPRSQWMNFTGAFARQSQYSLSIVDTAAQVQDIYDGIVKISKKAKVDARVILAVILLESTGNVNVACTKSPGGTSACGLKSKGINNCGIMQSYNGVSYNTSAPYKSIVQMIRDGTQGTATGPGLVQLFNDASDTAQETGGNVYKVLRAYNSGCVNSKNLDDGFSATDAYVSNIANYLLGWNGYGSGPAKCKFAKVSTSSTPLPSSCGTSAVPAPSPTTPGATCNCQEWYVVQSGDYCYKIEQQFNITMDYFLSLNPDINSGCTNLFAGDAYCVMGVAPPPTTTTTTSIPTTSTSSTSSTSPTGCQSSPPAPTPPGPTPTAACCSWYVVQGGDYCYKIETQFDITSSQFLSWNPSINSDCSNLYIGDAYCVGVANPSRRRARDFI